MIQECQGLPLGFKARDYRLRVHPRLDDLQSDLPLDRGSLVDEVRNTATSLAKFVYHLIRTDMVDRRCGRQLFLYESFRVYEGIDEVSQTCKQSVVGSTRAF
jgi:hypothetical protein